MEQSQSQSAMRFASDRRDGPSSYVAYVSTSDVFFFQDPISTSLFFDDTKTILLAGLVQ